MRSRSAFPYDGEQRHTADVCVYEMFHALIAGIIKKSKW